MEESLAARRLRHENERLLSELKSMKQQVNVVEARESNIKQAYVPSYFRFSMQSSVTVWCARIGFSVPKGLHPPATHRLFASSS
eukprot:1794657-Rhodomonas_salina.1